MKPYNPFMKVLLISLMILYFIPLSNSGSFISSDAHIIQELTLSDEPILIAGNADFVSQANQNGWPGSGTEGNPYILNHIIITSEEPFSPCIGIFDTTLHFEISDCTLTGAGYGIFLNNVSYAVLTDNIINAPNYNGIGLTYCTLTEVSYNLITNCGTTALSMDSSFGSNILGNVIVNSSSHGLYLTQCHNSTIISNTVYNANGWGFWTNSINTEVRRNNFIDNHHGYDVQVYVGHSSCVVYRNFYSTHTAPDVNDDNIVDQAYSISGAGLIDGAPHSTVYLTDLVHLVSSPFITMATEERIYDQFTITWNPSSCTSGDSITYDLYYTIVDGNWTQLATAIDNTMYEWDISGLINGYYQVRVVATCSGGYHSLPSDSLPVEVFNHYLDIPRVVSPYGGIGRFGEFINITWLPADDTYDHEVEYDVYYSDDYGETWILLAANLTETHWFWNITLIDPHYGYVVKVVAHCSEGLFSEDTTDGPFMILPHTLAPVYVPRPILNYTYDTSINIEWTYSYDSWEHEITYSVYYSSNGGQNWTEIATGLAINEYEWDISELPEGEYLVKIIATCSKGLSNEGTSKTFFIQHPTETEAPMVTIDQSLIIIGLFGVGIIVLLGIKYLKY